MSIVNTIDIYFNSSTRTQEKVKTVVRTFHTVYKESLWEGVGCESMSQYLFG